MPEEDLAAADELAQREDRSRSWVIAEAVRRYVTAAALPAASVAGASGERRQAGLGPSRRAQLIADLRLSPEARVRAAEETARVSFLLRPAAGKRVLAFDRYEDYIDWKRREERGG